MPTEILQLKMGVREQKAFNFFLNLLPRQSVILHRQTTTVEVKVLNHSLYIAQFFMYSSFPKESTKINHKNTVMGIQRCTQPSYSK